MLFSWQWSYVCYTCGKIWLEMHWYTTITFCQLRNSSHWNTWLIPNVLKSVGSCGGYHLLNHNWQSFSMPLKTQTSFLLNAYHFHKIRLKMLSWIVIIQAPTILRKTILLSSDIAESRKMKQRGRLPSKKNLPEWTRRNQSKELQESVDGHHSKSKIHCSKSLIF